MNLEYNVFNLAQHASSFTYILCTFFLLMRYKNGNRSRVIAGIIFLIIGVAVFLLLNLSHHEETLMPKQIIPITFLRNGLFAVLILFYYPIEIISPGWLTIKRAFLILSPWFLIRAIILFTQLRYRELYTLDDIWKYIDEPNVWFRLLIVVLILSCSYGLLRIPYNRNNSQADRQWVRLFTGLIQGIAVLYTATAFSNSRYISSLHQIYCAGITIIITYQELFFRLPSIPRQPANNQPIDQEKQSIQKIPPLAETPGEEATPHPLQEKLLLLMKEQQPWRNPDLTLNELSTLLGSNRTTLTNLVKEVGYESFNSFINTYRLKELINLITYHEINGLYEAVFDVGFRSKATALRYFRQETGMTPSDYLQQTLSERKKQTEV